MTQENEIYYIDTGAAKLYFQLIDDNTVQCRGNTTVMPRQKLVDFISTAQVLGLKAGRL